nr:hypothetical protein BaRGS_032945 [Batillaria attramentaria]
MNDEGQDDYDTSQESDGEQGSKRGDGYQVPGDHDTSDTSGEPPGVQDDELGKEQNGHAKKETEEAFNHEYGHQGQDNQDTGQESDGDPDRQPPDELAAEQNRIDIQETRKALGQDNEHQRKDDQDVGQENDGDPDSEPPGLQDEELAEEQSGIAMQETREALSQDNRHQGQDDHVKSQESDGGPDREPPEVQEHTEQLFKDREDEQQKEVQGTTVRMETENTHRELMQKREGDEETQGQDKNKVEHEEQQEGLLENASEAGGDLGEKGQEDSGKEDQVKEDNVQLPLTQTKAVDGEDGEHHSEEDEAKANSSTGDHLHSQPARNAGMEGSPGNQTDDREIDESPVSVQDDMEKSHSTLTGHAEDPGKENKQPSVMLLENHKPRDSNVVDSEKTYMLEPFVIPAKAEPEDKRGSDPPDAEEDTLNDVAVQDACLLQEQELRQEKAERKKTKRRQRENLTEKIQNLKREVSLKDDDLRERDERQQDLIENAITEKEKFEDKARQLAREKDELEANVDQLHSSLEASQDEVNSITNALRDQNSHGRQKERQIEELSAKVDDLEHRENFLQGALNRVEEAKEGAKREKERLEREQMQKVSELEEQLKVYRQRCTELDSKNQDLDEQLVNLTQYWSSMQAQASQTQKAHFDTLLQQKEEELSATYSRVNQLEQQVTPLEVQARNTESRLTDAQALNQTLEQTVSSLRD